MIKNYSGVKTAATLIMTIGMLAHAQSTSEAFMRMGLVKLASGIWIELVEVKDSTVIQSQNFEIFYKKHNDQYVINRVRGWKEGTWLKGRKVTKRPDGNVSPEESVILYRINSTTDDEQMMQIVKDIFGPNSEKVVNILSAVSPDFMSLPYEAKRKLLWELDAKY
jgi:hypothetical protein